ncbi:MAG: DUF2283 domain-containing protein [Patescibacteria group bacterium]
MKSPLQKIEYDKTVDALYVYALKGVVHKTYKLNSRVLLDVDKKGKLIGIEVLDASIPFSLGKVQDRETKIAV